MAIFERKIKPKSTLDDTQSLICTIETAQKVNGHTVRQTSLFSIAVRKKVILFVFINLINARVDANQVYVCEKEWVS